MGELGGLIFFGLLGVAYYILFGFAFHYLIKCQYSGSSGPNPQHKKDDILGSLDFIPETESEVEKEKKKQSDLAAIEKRWPLLPFALLVRSSHLKFYPVIHEYLTFIPFFSSSPHVAYSYYPLIPRLSCNIHKFCLNRCKCCSWDSESNTLLL